MVLNSVLKVVSAGTSLLIRYNKVTEGCAYLSKVHSSEEAYASVTSWFFKLCPVKFSEELSADLHWAALTRVLRVFGRGVPGAGSII